MHRVRSVVIAVLIASSALFPVLAPPASARAADKPIGIADLFELEWVDDPQLSPDGSRIVFERHCADVMKDRFGSELWIVGADGTGLEPLTTGGTGASEPRWSPDGTRLCYRAPSGGSPQLWVRWLASNRSACITNVQQAPTSIAWSPDGRFVAFLMFVAAPPATPFAPMPQKPEGAEWGKPARMIDKAYYRADGAGYLEDGYPQVFVVPADGGTPRQVTNEPFPHEGPLNWTEDGKSIVFAANRKADWDFDPIESEVCEVRIEDGVIAELTHRDGPDRFPALSPDGRFIAYVGFDDRQQGYQITRLYVMNRDGSESRVLTAALDRDAAAPSWAKDGSGVYFASDDRGNTHVEFATLDGQITTRVRDLGGTSIGRPYASGAFSVGPHDAVAFTVSRPDHPADLALATQDAPPRRLTRVNDDLLAARALASVEEIEWDSSFDGRRVQGWLVKPAGFDPQKKYPLVLEIHGGPFANYGDRFAFEMQTYAGAGYVVLYCNPRGSTSYGEAFGNLIHHDYPSQDYDDLMSGVDATIGLGFVDPNQLFVTGGSGGGALTAWIVGKTDRFRAAVAAKPVINWQSFVLTADETAYFLRYWFARAPWDDPASYAKRSPLTYAGNVKTPTMLLTGEVDYRTPISESEQFYAALKQRKIDAALVRIPDASHGMDARPTQLISKLAHVIAWFDKHRATAKK